MTDNINNSRQEKISSILKTHDPLGLIAEGAPNDEYSVETGQILEYLKSTPDELLLANYIHTMYREKLGKDFDLGSMDKYHAIAKEILTNT